MLRSSYWVCPIISGVAWLGTLLELQIYWNVSAERRPYPSMVDGQTIAYISDIGAAELKPVFISGCVITTVFLNLSLAADRWLRYKGRLAPNMTLMDKMLSGLAMFFAVVGTMALILLSMFDIARYRRLHDIFLLMFLFGFTISAVFICWEYRRLGRKCRDQRMLSISFWFKLLFILVEVPLTSVFAACHYTGHYNEGAVLEWTMAFIFSLYVFSFTVDLWPAASDKFLDFNERSRPGRDASGSESTVHLAAHAGSVPYELEYLRDQTRFGESKSG